MAEFQPITNSHALANYNIQLITPCPRMAMPHHHPLLSSTQSCSQSDDFLTLLPYCTNKSSLLKLLGGVLRTSEQLSNRESFFAQMNSAKFNLLEVFLLTGPVIRRFHSSIHYFPYISDKEMRCPQCVVSRRLGELAGFPLVPTQS